MAVDRRGGRCWGGLGGGQISAGRLRRTAPAAAPSLARSWAVRPLPASATSVSMRRTIERVRQQMLAPIQHRSAQARATHATCYRLLHRTTRARLEDRAPPRSQPRTPAQAARAWHGSATRHARRRPMDDGALAAVAAHSAAEKAGRPRPQPHRQDRSRTVTRPSPGHGGNSRIESSVNTD